MSNWNRKEKRKLRMKRFWLVAMGIVIVCFQVVIFSSSAVQLRPINVIASFPSAISVLNTINKTKNSHEQLLTTIERFRVTENAVIPSNISVVTNVAATTSNQDPLFVLHVGPPKTGTTSLQHMLQIYEHALLLDSYYYLGNAKIMGGDFTRCMNKMERQNHTASDRLCWETFIDILEFHRKLGHNIILSNEVIGLHATRPFAWSLIHDYLKHWTRVEIVVSYRHLHNFVPSAHYELQKNQRWPGPPEYGKPVTPITKFWAMDCNRTKVGPVPTPGAVMAKFGAHYTIKVLNVEKHDQISYFLCNILVEANHTCTQHLTNSSLEPPELNQRDDGRVNYDSLALMAWRGKLLKNEQTRRYLRGKIKMQQEGILQLTPNDFPLDCIDQLQESRLLDESLQHARDCGLEADGEFGIALRADFAKTKEKKRFCTINATLAFGEDKWQAFFGDAKTEW